MCNLADVTHSTADSKRSATDIMQVAADILPKTHFGLFKGEKLFFNKCSKGSNKHFLWGLRPKSNHDYFLSLP